MKKFNLRYTGVAMSIMAMSTLAAANNAYAQESEVQEEILVTGTRATIQSSIDQKRISTEIVDGLSADEIGDIPALSIGEALETITGASSHRENGGATEVSIRGLGPFLTNTVINGREATNGGGNRAVNFSIFPSELFNKIGIFKTQSASFIEGAVGGQIGLETKRPLDHGKQSIQLNLKGSYNPDEQDIRGGDDIGYRGTISYIDQFETENFGSFGISVGVQKSDTTNPEQEYTTGTGGGRLEACRLDGFGPNAQPVFLDTGRCDDVGSGDVTNTSIQGLIDDPTNGIDSVEDIPFTYLARDRRFRRNTTGDDRESFFGAVQWRPNDRLNINLDLQVSSRDQSELRQDLQFAESQEEISNLVTDDGIATSFTSRGEIRAITTDFSRDEDYEGIGLNFEYQVNDALTVSADLSYSDTRRVETDFEFQLGLSDGTAGNSQDFDIDFDLDAEGSDVLLATIDSDVDINDGSNFTGSERARLRARQIIRENTITAVRGDFSLDTENLGAINNIEGGVRFSQLEYDTFGGNRGNAGVNLFEDEDFDGVAGGAVDGASQDLIVATAALCAEDRFPEDDFLSNASGNQDLITTGSGAGSTFATFDIDCLGANLLANFGGIDAVELDNDRTTGSASVDEDTFAAYLQANYESELLGLPVRGNFGVRVVNTQISSTGFRVPLTISEQGTDILIVADTDSSPDNFETFTTNSSYTEVLPSFTLVADLSENVLFRGGFFRGLSRPDPNQYSNGRNIPTGQFDDLEDAVSGITASGNPNLTPLTSWNIDAALEWYPNKDTILAGGVYWKKFQGGFENTVSNETFVVDGQSVEAGIRTIATSDDSSNLYGFEMTASHAFTYLPGFLGGFGAKLSYNYASSDFEFNDGFGGDGTAFDSDLNPVNLIGVLDAAGLFGLSRNVASAQLYWSGERFDAQVIYKTRSQYFQQFTRDTTSRVRFTDDNDVLELRLSYKLTDNIKLSAEGLNLLNETRTDFRGVDGNVNQVLSYGPRFFFGVKAKL